MKCPFCQILENRVIDSRLSKDGDVIRRRRECESCNGRFTTYERVEEMMPMVIKRDGSRVLFDRTKVLAGLQRACQKRAIGLHVLEAIVSDLERELQDVGEKEIPSSYIGERVLDRLRDVDGVAYVRFASVYRSFADVNEFMAELKHLMGQKRDPGEP